VLTVYVIVALVLLLIAGVVLAAWLAFSRPAASNGRPATDGPAAGGPTAGGSATSKRPAAVKWRQEVLDGRNDFQQHRPRLEEEFMAAASESGKPRGLSWAKCEFHDAATFAMDRGSGQLQALVGVEISFVAIEGGGMEDNPNVGNVRAATAVFQRGDTGWSTQGRAIFNLEPLEAVKHFEAELALLPPES